MRKFAHSRQRTHFNKKQKHICDRETCYRRGSWIYFRRELLNQFT